MLTTLNFTFLSLVQKRSNQQPTILMLFSLTLPTECLLISETELVLIGTRVQLSKIPNPSLSSIPIFPSSTARKLGFVFDSHHSFVVRPSDLSHQTVCTISVTYAASAPSSTSKLPPPLPLVP
jgi:hypothetical protein